MSTRITAPPVHMILRAYPPAPARVGLVYRPLPLRLARAVGILLLFWTPAPASVLLPPHYPWPVLLLGAGLWYVYRATRPYTVRWFVGMCPRCGRDLDIPRGTPLRLPYVVGCCHCHFQSLLETYDERVEERLAAEDGRLRHECADCAGTWRQDRIWTIDFLVCDGCGARHHATPAVCAAAAAERELGRILTELADEGRYLD